jgi:hypothetical protein
MGLGVGNVCVRRTEMKRALQVVAALALAGALGGCYLAITPDGMAVGVDLAPVYAYIPGTQIRVVTNAGGDVFFYGGRYYRYHGGYWWHSGAWNSGWARAPVVPDAFLHIPATHPKYHVVRVHPHYRRPVPRTIRITPSRRRKPKKEIK